MHYRGGYKKNMITVHDDSTTGNCSMALCEGNPIVIIGSPHKGSAMLFSMMSAYINSSRECGVAGDLWCHMWCHYNDQWQRTASCKLITPINILRTRKNGRHFADVIFKHIFLNENIWIPIKISLKFVPKGSINNIPTLVQIVAWGIQATSHYLNQWWLIYRRIYASHRLNELIDMNSSVNHFLHEFL